VSLQDRERELYHLEHPNHSFNGEIRESPEFLDLCSLIAPIAASRRAETETMLAAASTAATNSSSSL
jgi:hypothetical protein